MKILDTSALDFAAKSGITLTEEFFVTPDVLDEFEVGHDRRLPRNVRNIFEMEWFDRATYLRSYKEMLNAHGGRSFYNMTGFGDVSILALLLTQKVTTAGMLPGLSGEIHLVSGDKGLINKARREFCNKTDSFSYTVRISKPDAYFKS